MGQLPSWRAAIEQLGKNNRERAAELGVSLRRYYYIRDGRHGLIQKLLKQPDVIAGLLEDARAGRTNGNHPADHAP